MKKAIIQTEIGFMLSRKRGEMLQKQAIGRFRDAVRDLWLLGKINLKQRDFLNFELDKILYDLKGGIK